MEATRGDKVVTLDQRLELIEGAVAKLEARVNRLFLMLGIIVTVGNSPEVIASLVGLFK